MSNTSYCRFENTYNDLDDCYDHMDDKDLNESEKVYREKLIKLCMNIYYDYAEDPEKWI